MPSHGLGACLPFRRRASITAPPTGCAYPLDGDITGAPFQPMTISGPGLQTATVAIAGSGTVEQYLSAPSGTFPGPFATLDFSSGVRVFGFAPSVPAAVNQAGSAPAYASDYRAATPAFATVINTKIEAINDGTFAVTVDIGGSTVHTSTTKPTFIAYVFDAGTSTASVLLDGVSVGSGSYTPGALYGLIRANETADSAAGDTGKVIGGTIVTTAAQFPAGMVPSGATDPCGDAVDTFFLTDSVGDYLTDSDGDYLTGA